MGIEQIPWALYSRIKINPAAEKHCFFSQSADNFTNVYNFNVLATPQCFHAQGINVVTDGSLSAKDELSFYDRAGFVFHLDGGDVLAKGLQNFPCLVCGMAKKKCFKCAQMVDVDNKPKFLEIPETTIHDQIIFGANLSLQSPTPLPEFYAWCFLFGTIDRMIYLT